MSDVEYLDYINSYEFAKSELSKAKNCHSLEWAQEWEQCLLNLEAIMRPYKLKQILSFLE